MLHTSTYLPAVRPVAVKVRVSPGLRLGSPVSATLSASSILSAPLVTGAGGSPESAMGIWSNGTSVFSTTISCSIVPTLVTMNVTSPAGAVVAKGVTDIGPSRPFASVRATSIGAPAETAEATVVIDTPPSFDPAGLLGGAHAAVTR